MRRIIVIGLLLLLIVMPVQAVDKDGLRVPRVEEFEYFEQRAEHIIFAWLRANSITLSQADEITVRDFVINIIPADFNVDGQDEWVFDIQSEQYNALWVVAEDASQQSGYRRVKTPFLAYSPTCPIQIGCGGGAAVLAIADVNVDGLPELIISTGGCGWGRCAVNLKILTWRDSTIVELTDTTLSRAPHWDVGAGGGDTPILPPEGAWTFQNIDNDPPLELIQTGVTDGSMNCTFQYTRIFDWHVDVYKYIGNEEVIDYDESAGCALRQAHLALKEGNHTAAIQNYERALRLFPGDISPELDQYTRLRLASAYALNNQETQSVSLIEELNREIPSTTLMGDLIEAAYGAYIDDRNSVALCAALYEVIADFDYWSNNESAILEFGQINDDGVSLNYGGGDFSPDNTGCNLSLLMRRAESYLNRYETLLEQLRDVGSRYSA